MYAVDRERLVALLIRKGEETGRINFCFGHTLKKIEPSEDDRTLLYFEEFPNPKVETPICMRKHCSKLSQEPFLSVISFLRITPSVFQIRSLQYRNEYKFSSTQSAEFELASSRCCLFSYIIMYLKHLLCLVMHI